MSKLKKSAAVIVAIITCSTVAACGTSQVETAATPANDEANTIATSAPETSEVELRVIEAPSLTVQKIADLPRLADDPEPDQWYRVDTCSTQIVGSTGQLWEVDPTLVDEVMRNVITGTEGRTTLASWQPKQRIELYTEPVSPTNLDFFEIAVFLGPNESLLGHNGYEYVRTTDQRFAGCD